MNWSNLIKGIEFNVGSYGRIGKGWIMVVGTGLQSVTRKKFVIF